MAAAEDSTTPEAVPLFGGRTETALESLAAIREQAHSYLVARYGDGVAYRAPETFGPFEQWVWAVSGAHDDMAAEVMASIVTHLQEAQK
jgi:hypothetical protein